MSHLATTEHDRYLDFIPFTKETHGIFYLEQVIVLVSFGTQFYFLNFNPDLLLFCIGSTLALLVLVLAVIHDPANRGFRGWRNFDQVEARLRRGLQGGIQVHDTQLVAFIVDDADLAGSDSLVDISCVLAYDAPPNGTVYILPE